MSMWFSNRNIAVFVTCGAKSLATRITAGGPRVSSLISGAQSRRSDNPSSASRRFFADIKRRFYGVKTLAADRIGIDFKNVVEQVIASLRAEGTGLTVRIEIEATKEKGFDESEIRTVSENARTLKF